LHTTTTTQKRKHQQPQLSTIPLQHIEVKSTVFTSVTPIPLEGYREYMPSLSALPNPNTSPKIVPGKPVSSRPPNQVTISVSSHTFPNELQSIAAGKKRASEDDAFRQELHKIGKFLGGVFAVALGLFMVIGVPVLLADSFAVVPYGKMALLQTRSGTIKPDVYSTGRHYVGVGSDMLVYPSTLINIDFSTILTSARRLQPAGETDEAHGLLRGFPADHRGLSEASDLHCNDFGCIKPDLQVRVLDGQLVALSFSFQLRLLEGELHALHRDYKDEYMRRFISAIEHRIHHSCARFASEEVFGKRREVEAAIEAAARDALVGRHAEVVGLQMQGVTLPQSIEDHIQRIEYIKYSAVQEELRAELLQLRAIGNRELLQVQGEASAVQMLLQHKGAQAVALLALDRQLEEAATARAELKLVTVCDRGAQLLGNETLNSLYALHEAKAAEDAATALQVVMETGVWAKRTAVYEQHTENNRLEIQVNVTRAEEGTKQMVANETVKALRWVVEHNATTELLQVGVLNQSVVGEERGKLALAKVQAKVAGAHARLEASRAVLDAGAAAATVRNDYHLAAYRIEHQALATAEAHAALVSGLAEPLTPSELLHLEWVSSHRKLRSGAQELEVATPAQLQLPGQALFA
jgi:hypothetical protein